MTSAPPIIPPATKSASTTKAAALVLLPAEKFFVRRIALAPGQEVATQVELALEMHGPFSPTQTYHGYFVSKDGQQAVLFAAFRKNFSPEETSTWSSAETVLPASAVWLGQTPRPAAGVWVHEHADVVQVVVWDGAELPAAILCQKADCQPAETVVAALLAEAAARYGVSIEQPRRLGGTVLAATPTKENQPLRLDQAGPAISAALPLTALRGLDVRDKTELRERERLQRRANWLWHLFAIAVAGLCLGAIAELGLFVVNRLSDGRQQIVQGHIAAAQKIKLADTLADRLEKLAAQQMKPLEMIAAVNAQRPGSMVFNRVTASAGQLEVEAQTANAADVSVLEQNLRQAPVIQLVEVREQRMREGLTTFQFTVTFKPGFPAEEGSR